MTKKWIDRVNLPTEEGFYCARDSDHDWWNLVVLVHGDSPFFCVDIWRFMTDKLYPNASVYQIEEFGPKLADRMLPSINRTAQGWKEFND